MERVIMVARLKPDAYDRARELAEAGAPDDDFPLRRSVHLSSEEVIFVLEGEDAELQKNAWFDDPVRSSALTAWLPLFDGPLHRAPEVAVWEPQAGSR